jgi:ectoine hydroxylase-related dioxygenase (phytanoyl-CoA dioxygenase family)
VRDVRTTSAEATVESVVAGMEDDGYVIVEGVLSPTRWPPTRAELLEVLARTPTGRNDFEGFATQRIYALFAKTRAFDGLATSPLLEGVLERVLGPHQLSAPVGIQIGPGEKAQPLHRDDGVYPLARPHPDVVVNTDVALRRLHRGERRHPPRPPEPPLRRPTRRGGDRLRRDAGGLGDVLPGLALARRWGERTDRPRLGVILEYAPPWLRPQETHLLAVPREVAADLPERLQELLGYNIYPPFLGYVDGRHPRRVLQQQDGRLAHS